MARTIHKTAEPVILEGYQAVLKPSKFGYSLSAIVDEPLINDLTSDRQESLKWAESKLKNPKTHITDENLPIYGGAKVKLAFYQKPYILRDGVTYGTSLKLVGVQLVSINSEAGVDTGDMNAEDVAALFGTTTGFKASDPNVTPAESSVEDDEF